MSLSVKNRGSDIPTSSMADLAFLLLIFFFVAAVIDVDSGIGLTLPEYTDQEIFDPVSHSRLAAILINANNEILLNDVSIPLSQLKDRLKEKIKDRIDLPKNKKLIVSIKYDRKTKYGNYISLLDEVKLSFYETRDEFALAKYGVNFDKLNEEKQKLIKEAIPVTISIADPEESE